MQYFLNPINHLTFNHFLIVNKTSLSLSVTLSLSLSSSREEDGQDEVVPGVEVCGFGQRVTNYRLCLRARTFDRVVVGVWIMCVCGCVFVCLCVCLCELCVLCVCVCVCVYVCVCERERVCV